MRISLLLDREPFGAIASRTLAGFWSRRSGQDVAVRWGRRGASPDLPSGSQEWLCNPYLNAIFVSAADPSLFDTVRREFTRSAVAWRRPLQRLYVAGALSRGTAGLFSAWRLWAHPPIKDAAKMLIVAGNHKLRVLIPSEDLAWGLLKDGFPAKHMRNEITARRRAEAAGIPVPALRDVDEQGTWFSEDFIVGTPLNRIANQSRAVAVREAAFAALRRLTADTLRTVPTGEYLNGLKERSARLLADNRLLSEGEKQRCRDVVAHLAGRLSDTASPARVTLAQTHGDFQPGNVIDEGNRWWCIDWEYAGERQAGYDVLTHMLATRFPDGLAGRIDQFVRKGMAAGFGAAVGWPGLAIATERDRQFHADLVLLEDVVLHLEENENPQYMRPGAGLCSMIREAAARHV